MDRYKLSTFSFNLAIEILVISGRETAFLNVISSSWFQSRNRDSCHFRFASSVWKRGPTRFQSRNRDSCHFRHPTPLRTGVMALRFNLAIEILVISGGCCPCPLEIGMGGFQSRNRDSCHFRRVRAFPAAVAPMFQSRNRDSCHFRPLDSPPHPSCSWFQSRNRDSCHFRFEGARV